MKQYPYCGAEYPDDAIACAIDDTLLPGAAPVPPAAAIASRKERIKIPLSFSIVSYLFFAEGAIRLIGFVVGVYAVLVLSDDPKTNVSVMFCRCLLNLILGVFFVLLSRGLRRCSRVSRACALVLIWLGFIGLAVGVFRCSVTLHTTGHQAAKEFLLVYVLGFLITLWAYRVLTREDVRDLFFKSG